nr:hypothetical protein [Tanacetum cinerariifolium]
LFREKPPRVVPPIEAALTIAASPATAPKIDYLFISGKASPGRSSNRGCTDLLIANIKALKDNPTPSFDFMTKSSSTSLNSLLEETNTFDNSLPELETFCFDLEEISSGSTTTHSDISHLDYEAFYDDHVKEISSGSTTTHSDSSLYYLFIFDLLIYPFPLADRSDFYEFANEHSHIISPSEYDCFCFKNEPNSGDFTMDMVEDIFPTREPRVHNAFPTHPTLQLNLDFILSSESLFTYVVWIFLPFLSYLVAPQYLLSFGNKDTVFDPDFSSYHISSFMLDVSHRSGTFMKINKPASLLLLWLYMSSIPGNLKTRTEGFYPPVFISSASLGNHKYNPFTFFLFKTHSQLRFDFSIFRLIGTRPGKGIANQSPEWNTHVVVWMNSADLDTMSMDDLYNNLKVYEPEVKEVSSLISSTQNMAFVSSSNNNTSITNGVVNTAQVVNTAHGVSTASTQVNAA